MVLGVIASIVGAIAQAQAAAAQNQVMRENLQFQKEQADRQYDLATAPRTDAYGNETGFDDLLNEWYTNLTPTQKRLIAGEQREQRLSLEEDAPRARYLRERQEQRSLEAEDLYDELMSEYRYNEPDDEGTIFDRMIGDIAGARASSGNRAKNAAGGAAARFGLPRGTDTVLRDTTDAITGEDVLRARGGAANEAAQRKQQHRGLLDEINAVTNIIDDINPASIFWPSTNQDANARQSDMVNQIASALSGGASAVGQAYGQLADTIRAPDLGGVASALNGLKLGGGGMARGGTATGGGTDRKSVV